MKTRNTCIAVTTTLAGLTLLAQTATAQQWTTNNLPPGLISWWNADGNTLDTTGLNPAGSSGQTYGPGRFGQAFHFDGINQSVAAPGSASLDQWTQFTLEAWMKLDQTEDLPAAAPGRMVINRVGNAADHVNYNQGYQFGFWNNARSLVLAFNTNNQAWPGFYTEAVLPASLPTNVWLHVAATYDHNAVMLYLNGVPLVTNVIGAATVAHSTSAFRIGMDDNGNCPFAGSIDDVRVYNRALSKSEIAYLYAGPPPAPVITSAINVVNPGFEILPADASWPGAYGYGYTTNIPGWTNCFSTGVGTGGGALVTSPPPDGTYAAFMQSATARLSQNLSGFVIGTAYTVQFLENMRGGYAAPNLVQVRLGGSNLASYSFASYGSGGPHARFCRRVTDAWIATSTDATLQFTNGSTGDATWNIDAVSVTRAIPVVSNGGFEFGNSARYTYRPANAGWTFVDNTGIAADSLTPAAVVPEGSYAGFLQGKDAYFWQTITGLEPGVTYALKWLDGGRSVYGSMPYILSLGGTVLYASATNGSDISTTSWAARAVLYTAISNSAVLQFAGQDYAGDHATAFDDIHFEFSAQAAAPPLLTLLPAASGTFAFQWDATPGRAYLVQTATSLSVSNWTSLGSSFVTSNSPVAVTNAIGADAQRFYRILVQ